MAVRFQFRRGTAAEWTAANPTLAEGEFGLETDTDQFKIGDGTTAWTSLSYGGIVGPTGATGAAGADGADGVDGADGADGGFDTAQTINNLTSLTLVDDNDAGTLKTNTGAGGNISIVISNFNSLAVGKQIDFLQTSTNQFEFAAEVGLTLYSKDGKLKTAGQYSPASIKCIATNTYVLVGDLGA